MKKLKLKKGDSVKVISGKFRHLVDQIHHLEPKKNRVYLAKASRKVYDKSPEGKKKSLVKEILIPLDISNLQAEKSPKKLTTNRKIPAKSSTIKNPKS